MTYDRTRLKARYFDRERRRRLGEGARLTLYEKKPGPEDEKLLEIDDGWDFNRERIRGRVETLAVIEIIARNEITADLMSRATRIDVEVEASTTTYRRVSYDPPIEAPLLWTLFLEENKPGAVKR